MKRYERHVNDYAIRLGQLYSALDTVRLKFEPAAIRDILTANIHREIEYLNVSLRGDLKWMKDREDEDNNRGNSKAAG